VTTNVINSQIDLDRGLQAYFPFDGSVEDVSSANNTAELNEAILAPDGNGYADRAYAFDGIDDYIRISNSPDLDFDRNEPFAISIWFQTMESENGFGSTDIISKWETANLGVPYSYTLRITTRFDDEPGEVTIARFDSNDSGCQNVSVIRSEPIYNDNEWHHAIFQLTEENFLQLYIDCELIGEVEDFSSCSLLSDSDIYLGMRTPLNPSSTQPFTGSLDELRIYNRSLEPEELNQLCSVINSTDESAGAPELSFIPNPTTGNIQIIKASDIQLVSGKIYDVNGSFVEDIEELNFNISGAPGIYIAVLRYENGTISTHKIVKSHSAKL